MTNEDYEQWLPLIKKVAWKHRNNKYDIELEDLEQIAVIGIMKAFDTYTEEKETTINTWIYKNADWAIKRKFLYLKRIKKQSEYRTISIETPVDENLLLGDMIQDETDYFKELDDEIVITTYKKEIDLCIHNEVHRNIIKSTLFTDLTLKQIACLYDVPYAKVRRIKDKGYKTLRETSPMIRAKYIEYIERREANYLLNAYKNNPEKVILHDIQSKNVRNRYKKEIDILDLLQNLFDYLDGYLHEDCKIKKFYLLGLTTILDKSDIETLNRYIFEKEDIKVLVNEGYSYYEVIDIVRNIKSNIIEKKEEVYRLWREYNEFS